MFKIFVASVLSKIKLLPLHMTSLEFMVH